MSRGTNLIVNLNAVSDNADYIYQISKKKILAVIKANAYGLGVKGVATKLEHHQNVAMFGVATVKEALELRRIGIKKEIIVLGAILKEDLNVLKANNIIVNLYHETFYKSLSSEDKKDLRVHIKVDSGMNRLGFKSVEAIREVLKDEQLEIDGIFTHYATSDSDEAFVIRQFNDFKSILNELNYPFKWIHASNSGASLHLNDTFTNLVRPGISLFGEDPVSLESISPAVKLQSVVVEVHQVNKGETVGYGRTYLVEDEIEYIATVPIGYADGLLRINQGGDVVINNKRYPIVGRICMDQTMIKVDKSVKFGDCVEFFGDHISLLEVAQRTNTIVYEVLTNISERVERKYEGL